MAVKMKATANAGANIALIKYWGARDPDLNIPLNDSVSLTLDETRTTTTVEFDPDLDSDTLSIGGEPASDVALNRASRHLNLLRDRAGLDWRAHIVSENTFPMGAGIASSASAFAALTVAAAAALRLDLTPREMSRIARRGSGSASRSLYGGYVRWQAGHDDASSYAEQIAPRTHWDLRDVIVIVEEEEKPVSSSQGHRLAQTSAFLQTRLEQVEETLPLVRTAILDRDLASLGPIIEADALAMHFVMMSSTPPLFYWAPATIAVLKAMQRWRADGLEAYFTIDAGPNVHVICEAADADTVVRQAQEIAGVQGIIVAGPGEGPRLL